MIKKIIKIIKINNIFLENNTLKKIFNLLVTNLLGLPQYRQVGAFTEIKFLH